MAGEPLRVKHVFELDNRQLMAIFAGIFLMLVLFFGLGINVGWRLSIEMGGGTLSDSMGAMQPTETNDEFGDNPNPDQPLLAPPSEATPIAEKAPEPEAAKPASEGPSLLARLQQAEQTEQRARGAGSPPPQQKTPVVVPNVPPEEKKNKPTPPAEEPLPPTFNEVKAKAPAPKKETKEPPAPKKTVAKTPPPPPPPVEKPANSTKKQYTVQFHSFRTRERAQKVIDKFKPFDDRKPFIMEMPVDDTLTWYKVCIGKFQDYQQAKAYERIYKEKTKDKQTMVTRVLN